VAVAVAVTDLQLAAQAQAELFIKLAEALHRQFH
jgi:hypothetical protein